MSFVFVCCLLSVVCCLLTNKYQKYKSVELGDQLRSGLMSIESEKKLHFLQTWKLVSSDEHWNLKRGVVWWALRLENLVWSDQHWGKKLENRSCLMTFETWKPGLVRSALRQKTWKLVLSDDFWDLKTWSGLTSPSSFSFSSNFAAISGCFAEKNCLIKSWERREIRMTRSLSGKHLTVFKRRRAPCDDIVNHKSTVNRTRRRAPCVDIVNHPVNQHMRNVHPFGSKLSCQRLLKIRVISAILGVPEMALRVAESKW